MKTIDLTKYCNWCEIDFEEFNEESVQEMIIRRYVGGHGHLIDIAYHRECWKQRPAFTLEAFLDRSEEGV